MNKAIEEALAEEKEKPIKENVMIRLSIKERELLSTLTKRLNLSQGAVIRIAIRALEKQTKGKT
jgi:hypothetical protein